MRGLKNNVFLKILKEKKGLKEDILILKIGENKKKQTRWGILVPKKVCKKAVLRNKIRRRIREILQKRKKQIKKGKNLVFITLPGIEKRKFFEIERIVDKLLFKSKIIK